MKREAVSCVDSLIRSVAVIVVVGALISCSGGTSQSTAESPPMPEARTVAGMPNAVQVGDLLFGGQPTPDALRTLREEGYRTVLNTRGDGELKWDESVVADTLDMAYVSIPMGHPIEAITDAQVARFDDLMKHGDRPMVLHCSSGNRVAGLWAVWLVEEQGMDPGRALDLAAKAGMTRIRPVVEKRLAASNNE